MIVVSKDCKSLCSQRVLPAHQRNTPCPTFTLTACTLMETGEFRRDQSILFLIPKLSWASLVAQMVKNVPVMRKT